ncbi:MAG: hypothetical protein OQK77_07485 [Psychromonas sp.]|nr:hypothetical protein [Psychromonas sp.]
MPSLKFTDVKALEVVYFCNLRAANSRGKQHRQLARAGDKRQLVVATTGQFYTKKLSNGAPFKLFKKATKSVVRSQAVKNSIYLCTKKTAALLNCACAN